MAVPAADDETHRHHRLALAVAVVAKLAADEVPPTQQAPSAKLAIRPRLVGLLAHEPGWKDARPNMGVGTLRDWKRRAV
jgi:hypothetical protein